MQYYVYVLQSLKDKKYYTGSTNNLERRLTQHNEGLTSSLKSRLPLKLVYSEIFNTKEESRKRERQIKAYKGGEAFKNLIKK